MTRLLIVAGDPSGDLIATKLVRSLKKKDPHVQITGIGGENLKSVCDKFLVDIVGEHALGFALSIKTILFFRNILTSVIEPELDSTQYDAVIPVDFYGFNYRVAALAKKKKLKVYYYVSPQFWASRPARAERLRPFVDLFICLFPFEKEFYDARQLPAHFVGHPLLDSIPLPSNGYKPKLEPLIGLLPGSRPEEIKKHLPIMIEAGRLVHESHELVRFVLFTVPHVNKDLYKSIINDNPKARFLIEFVQDEDHSWRAQLDMAITASGLETLENTFFGIPMVVIYKTNWITYFLARCLITIPFVGMPNVLAQKKVVPEFIQSDVTPEKLAAELINWIKNPEQHINLRNELLRLRHQFGENGASDRAANVILEKLTV